jgi:hypothetical protein
LEVLETDALDRRVLEVVVYQDDVSDGSRYLIARSFSLSLGTGTHITFGVRSIRLRLPFQRDINVGHPVACRPALLGIAMSELLRSGKLSK